MTVSKWTNNENQRSRNDPSPVWQRPQNRYGSNRWVVFSPKLKRKVILYSDLEYDHWVLVEATPSIKSFCEQPRRVRVQLPSGPVTTVFDIWILWDTQHQEYREIKYRHELLNAPLDSRIHRQIQAQKKWCEIDRATHTVMTDEVIRANPILLSNWKFILSNLACTQYENLSSHLENVRSMLMRSDSKTLQEIENSFPAIDRCLIRASIFTLIHSGHLKAPLDVQPLNVSTQIDIAL
jgi:hypothetical protein